MAETTLLALAVSVQDAHAHLSGQLDSLPEPGVFLIAETGKRLAQIVAAIREREDSLDSMHDALAERMNQLLEAIENVSDLRCTSAATTRALGNLS